MLKHISQFTTKLNLRSKQLSCVAAIFVWVEDLRDWISAERYLYCKKVPVHYSLLLSLEKLEPADV